MITKLNNEVFYSNSSLPLLNKKNLNFLIKKAKKNKSHKSRICTHANKNKKLHEMFVVHTKNYNVRPHKHKFKEESLYVIEGQADLIIYDNKGKKTKTVKLGTVKSGDIFYYRINNSVFHSLKIKSNYFIFHETTTGPFIRKNTIFANWQDKLNK